jgi:hypothetical protein
MPNALRPANYKLRIDGRLATGEILFSEEKSLIFDQKAVSIIVQVEKPDYEHDMMCKLKKIRSIKDEKHILKI